MICKNIKSNRVWSSKLDGPLDNILGLTEDEICSLPTITELFELIQYIQLSFNYNGGWQNSVSLSPFVGMPGIRAPYRAFLNDTDYDNFILTRLNSGRFSLKPNLNSTPFLFRGQNKVYKKIEASFDRCDVDNKLISNLKYTDFYLLLKTHPLFRLFDAGIYLEGHKKPIFFEMNYYGLAQHYGFNSGLIDFTSDIGVASFFASSRWKGDDEYEVFDNEGKASYGVIYVYEINPHISFIQHGFTTIGHQVFPRSGAQKGFLQNSDICDVNELPNIWALPFRHDFMSNSQIFTAFDKGKTLFPEDGINDIAKEILQDNQVSLKAFAYNLYVNPSDDKTKNEERCNRKGVIINPNLNRVFNKESLDYYYESIKQGWWFDFCEHIYFGDDDQSKLMKDALLKLPGNPYYEQYFNPEYYDLLYYHQVDDVRKSKR